MKTRASLLLVLVISFSNTILRAEISSSTEEITGTFISILEQKPPIMTDWRTINKKVELQITYEFGGIRFKLWNTKEQSKYIKQLDRRELIERLMGQLNVLHIGKIAQTSQVVLSLDIIGSKIYIGEGSKGTYLDFIYRGSTNEAPTVHFMRHIQSSHFKENYNEFIADETYKWNISQSRADIAEERAKEQRKLASEATMNSIMQGLSMATQNFNEYAKEQNFQMQQKLTDPTKPVLTREQWRQKMLTQAKMASYSTNASSQSGSIEINEEPALTREYYETNSIPNSTTRKSVNKFKQNPYPFKPQPSCKGCAKEM